jgi:hypothetical protein
MAEIEARHALNVLKKRKKRQLEYVNATDAHAAHLNRIEFLDCIHDKAIRYLSIQTNELNKRRRII